jgi:hypothetical protein
MGEDESARRHVAKFVNSVNLTGSSLVHWDRLMSAANACLKGGRIKPQVALNLIRESQSRSLDHRDLLSLCRARALLKGDLGIEAEGLLRPKVIDYWEDNIAEDIRQNGTLDDLYSEDDVIEGERLVREAVDSILAEYGLEFEPSDMETIASRVDVASEIEANCENSSSNEDYDSSREGGWRSIADPIDDLFHVDGPIRGPK